MSESITRAVVGYTNCTETRLRHRELAVAPRVGNTALERLAFTARYRCRESGGIERRKGRRVCRWCVRMLPRTRRGSVTDRQLVNVPQVGEIAGDKCGCGGCTVKFAVATALPVNV